MDELKYCIFNPDWIVHKLVLSHYCSASRPRVSWAIWQAQIVAIETPAEGAVSCDDLISHQEPPFDVSDGTAVLPIWMRGELLCSYVKSDAKVHLTSRLDVNGKKKKMLIQSLFVHTLITCPRTHLRSFKYSKSKFWLSTIKKTEHFDIRFNSICSTNYSMLWNQWSASWNTFYFCI